MSSKKTFHVEESASNEYENDEEFNQINEAIPKSKKKFLTNGLKLSNKKEKNISEKYLYRSTSNGTKIKICCVNPNLMTSVDHEDNNQTVKTSSNTRRLEQGSNDSLTTNDLILHNKKNTLSKKRKCPYIPKKTRKKISYVDSDVGSSVVDGDNIQRVVTSCEKKKLKSNLPLDNSKNIGEVIVISSGSEDNLINYDLTKQKKNKMPLKMKKRHSKLKKRKTSCPDITPAVNEDDFQEFISGNIKQEPHSEDTENPGNIKPSSEVNSESEEKLVHCDSILPSTEKDFCKKSVYCSIPKAILSNIFFEHSNVETSVVNEDNAKVHKTSNSTKKKVKKTPLDNTNNFGEMKPFIENNSDINDIVTTNDLMLPIKKRGRSLNLKLLKKKIDLNDTDLRIPAVQQNDTQRLITSCNSRNMEVESLIENSENHEEFEQSNRVPLRNTEILPKNNLNLSKKKPVASQKIKRHSFPKKTKRKICNIDFDSEKSIICSDDSQMFKISNNSESKELESFLNDSENVGKSEQIEKSTSDGVRLLKKDKVVPKRLVRFSISDVPMRDISDVDSDLETSFTHEDDTQVFKISSNTRNIEQDSSLDNNIDSEEIECNLDKDILTTNDSISPKKKKAISKKSVHCSITKGTKRKNIDCNTETSVVSEDVQESITLSNNRTAEQKSLLNDTDNIVNVEQSIVTNPESSEISTTDNLNLLLQEKIPFRKRCHSDSKRKNKKLSNTDVILPDESKTNNPESNSEYLTIYEFQPRVLVEVLNDNLLQKYNSNKNLKIADKNFNADKLSFKVTDEPSKPEEPPLKTKATSNYKVSPCSNSNLKFSSQISHKIKRKKLGDYEKSSNIQKYSSSSKHDKVSGVHDIGSSKTNKLLEQSNETADTSQISNSETTMTTTRSPYNESKKIELCNRKNSDPPSINIDLVNDTSSDIDIDWMIVDPKKLAEIDSLQKEMNLLDHMHQLRSALRTTCANYEIALETLEKLYDLNIDAFMLLKNTDVIDTIVKVTKYIGNAREWNLSEEEVLQHDQKACQIRRKARSVFYMFKSLFNVPNGKTFQEVYIKEVNNFLAKTKDKSCFQVIDESTAVNE